MKGTRQALQEQEARRGWKCTGNKMPSPKRTEMDRDREKRQCTENQAESLCEGVTSQWRLHLPRRLFWHESATSCIVLPLMELEPGKALHLPKQKQFLKFPRQEEKSNREIFPMSYLMDVPTSSSLPPSLFHQLFVSRYRRQCHCLLLEPGPTPFYSLAGPLLTQSLRSLSVCLCLSLSLSPWPTLLSPLHQWWSSCP